MESHVERAPSGRGKESQHWCMSRRIELRRLISVWRLREAYPNPVRFVSASSQRSLSHHSTHDGHAPSLKYMHLLPHQPDPANMSPPPSIRVTGEYDCGATLSHFICSAVAISPEVAKWPKRLTSGELRIGPRRHKLICDEDGTLRQEFLNVV